MIKKKVAVIIAICGILFSAAQGSVFSCPEDDSSQIQWLKDNAVPIKSADPRNTDFSDLMPLVEKIGNARIVLLGEQSHCDGTVFLMKARLVHFLHEVMGFDVLAWESGLYDCREMNAALRSDMQLEEAILKGIFAVWGISEQVYPVFAYAKSTYDSIRPLEMTGFDCQFSSCKNTLASFPSRLESFFDRADPSILKPADRELLNDIVNFSKLTKMSAEKRVPYKKFIEFLPELILKKRSLLEKFYDAKEIGFWLQVAKNTKVFHKMIEDDASRGETLKASDNNIRDEAMGKTLIWLADQYYSDRKIIVWAASFHNMRKGSEIGITKEDLSYDGLKTMGDWIYDTMGEQTYNITFTTYKGKAGSASYYETIEIPAAPKGSIEDKLHQLGNEYLFVDFRSLPANHWLRSKMPMRPLGYSYMTTDWTKHFDAMIYIETMKPSTSVFSEDHKEQKNSK